MNTRLLLVALGLVGSSVVIACTSSAPDTGLNEAAVNGDDTDEKPAKNNASSSSSSSGSSTTGDAGIPSANDASAPATNNDEGAFDPNGDLKQQYSDCLQACDEEDDDCFDKCDASLAAALGGEDGKDGEDGADGNSSRCCTKGQAFLCPDAKSCSAAGIGNCTRRADLDKNCSK